MEIEYVYPKVTKAIDKTQVCASDVDCSISFKDVFDVVNPLQQLPIIGDIYRSLTGDTISAGARVAGGFLLGGPIGFMTAAVNAGLEAATGADAVEHAVAFLGFGGGNTQFAAAQYKKISQLS